MISQTVDCQPCFSLPVRMIMIIVIIVIMMIIMIIVIIRSISVCIFVEMDETTKSTSHEELNVQAAKVQWKKGSRT